MEMHDRIFSALVLQCDSWTTGCSEYSDAWNPNNKKDSFFFGWYENKWALEFIRHVYIPTIRQHIFGVFCPAAAGVLNINT